MKNNSSAITAENLLTTEGANGINVLFMTRQFLVQLPKPGACMGLDPDANDAVITAGYNRAIRKYESAAVHEGRMG